MPLPMALTTHSKFAALYMIGTETRIGPVWTTPGCGIEVSQIGDSRFSFHSWH